MSQARGRRTIPGLTGACLPPCPGLSVVRENSRAARPPKLPTEKESYSTPEQQTCIMNEEMAAMLDYVRAALPESGAHGFDHTERVVRLCERIGAQEGADMAILIPAALFHDIAPAPRGGDGRPPRRRGSTDSGVLPPLRPLSRGLHPGHHPRHPCAPVLLGYRSRNPGGPGALRRG